MCYIILLLVMAKKQNYIFWGNNECMLGKKHVHFYPKTITNERQKRTSKFRKTNRFSNKMEQPLYTFSIVKQKILYKIFNYFSILH